MRRLAVAAVVLAVLIASMGGTSFVGRTSAAQSCAGFADVTTDDPACAAIAALVARNIITGYATNPPTFGPADTVQRAQIAAFLVRALRWQNEAKGPKSFTDFGPLAVELRNSALILANKCDSNDLCAARGYDPAACDARLLIYPCFDPNSGVTYAQVISFVARAFQFDPLYNWVPQPNGALPYQGVPSVHQTDVKTYHAKAGPIPAAPFTTEGWSQEAPRAWVARVLFKALNLPSAPSPSPSPSPPSAAAFKNLRLTLVDRAVAALLDVLDCSGVFGCFSDHYYAQEALNEGLATLLSPPNPTPPQCTQLAAKVLSDWSLASQQLGASSDPALKANAAAAAATLGGTREAIRASYGGCQ